MPTMYDFQASTDTLKFWAEKRAINKTFFVFHPILIKLGEVGSTHFVLQFHQVSSKSDEEQKKFY